MIAPGNLNTVINNNVHIFKGIFIFIKDPSRLIPNIRSNAINNDLNNHFKKFFI
jgi:hypothetical protein